MTKAELLADLAERFTVVVSVEPHPQNATELPTKRYLTVVLETAIKDGVPIAIQRQVNFYVLNESTETESAYYMNEEPKSILAGEAALSQG